MSNVNLYQIPQVVQLAEGTSVGTGTVLNRCDFRVFKYVDTEIDFLIKDYDNKPVNLSNKTLTILIVNEQTQKLVTLTNPELVAINATKGHCRLTIPAADTMEWDLGYYSYSVVVQRSDATQVLLYTDKARTAKGYLEVFQGPLPTPTAAIEIKSTDFRNDTSSGMYGTETVFVAEPYEGSAQRGNRSGAHTVAVYFTNFTGDFIIQASLENAVPSLAEHWFPVTADVDSHLVDKNGIQHFNFQGNFMWLRFIVHPTGVNWTVNPLNTVPLSKLLLKN